MPRVVDGLVEFVRPQDRPGSVHDEEVPNGGAPDLDRVARDVSVRSARHLEGVRAAVVPDGERPPEYPPNMQVTPVKARCRPLSMNMTTVGRSLTETTEWSALETTAMILSFGSVLRGLSPWIMSLVYTVFDRLPVLGV